MNPQFKENFHGILTHDGWVKVAKFNISATVINIIDRQIHVKTNQRKYLRCQVHKNLVKDIKYIDVGDEVGIKWNMDKAYVVAFRKAEHDTFKGNSTGDFPIFNNGKGDWITFFKRIDAE